MYLDDASLMTYTAEVTHTVRAGDDGAALVGPLLHGAVLADGLGEGAHAQVAHEHAVVARAVEARLVGHDAVALAVVLEVVVAAI